MGAAGDLGVRLRLDLLGRQRVLGRIVLGGRRLRLLALALGFGVRAGLGGWAAEAELGGRGVEEAGLDAGEGALGEEVYAVDDLVEEGLRGGWSVSLAGAGGVYLPIGKMGLTTGGYPKCSVKSSVSGFGAAIFAKALVEVAPQRRDRQANASRRDFGVRGSTDVWKVPKPLKKWQGCPVLVQGSNIIGRLLRHPPKKLAHRSRL